MGGEALASEGSQEPARTLDATALDNARFGFHRSHPQRSARRVFYVTQCIVIGLLGAASVWAFRDAPAASFFTLHVAALVLFTAAIAWRLVAASILTPTLSRLAEPAHWPTYTILCPLYREASVVADLVAALERLDYPGIMHQRGV